LQQPAQVCNHQDMRAAADLTGAALIRETAMRLTAERGWDAVSIRDIAAAAQVSSSLVVHHYRTKAGLREAVDRRVVEALTELLDQLSLADNSDNSDTDNSDNDDNGDAGDLMAMSMAAAFHRRFGDGAVLDYIRRLLVDGGPAAAELFDALFAATERVLVAMEDAGVLTPSEDRAARAAFLLVNDLAVVLLRSELTRVLGVDPLGRSGLQRWGRTVMDVYLHGAFAGSITQDEEVPDDRATR
jgi:AcrR family transcriptional regulator